MLVIIEQEVTVADLDEAIGHFYHLLKDDRYGHRIDWRKKKEYWGAINDLLDARIAIVNGQKPE
jgi:hypothetical protein